MKLLSVLLAIFLPLQAIAEECVVDNTDVELIGEIQKEVFPGPPNYQSIENGDKSLTYWILTTHKEYCGVMQSMENGGWYLSEDKITRLQLVLNQEQYAQFDPLIPGKAKVSGRTFAGHNGHHNTPILIDVSSIESAGQ